MKKLVNLMVTALMGFTCLSTFTACGGDDDDEESVRSETGMLTVGTHRVDVDFSGNTSGWTVTVGFLGTSYPITTEGSALYENGEKLSTDIGGWVSDKFRSYSVTSDDKCQSLQCAVFLRRNAHSTAQPVTIDIKSYVNGKQKKTKSYVVDGSHSSVNIIFYSEIMDGDQEFYNNY